MKAKILGAIAGLSVASVGALAGVAVANSAANLTPANAETVQTTRRVWVVNNADWWTDGVVVHAWGGASEENITVTWLDFGEGNQYSHGLGYADLSVDSVHILFKSKNTWDYETCNYDLSGQIDGLDDSADAFYLNSGDYYNQDKKKNCRNSSIGSVPMSEIQLATLFSYVTTCESSYAVGWNAYPQLLVNFVLPTDADKRNGVIPTKNLETGSKITVGQKVEFMRTKYNRDHGTNLD